MEPIHEKVLSYIKQNGPVLPIQVAKMLGRETYYAGAILSDLLSQKLIKMSSARVGGSSLYYTEDQQEKLSMLYNHLPLREKEAYELLKEKKVINDTEVVPAIRVAFQMLKDFAVPFEFNNAKLWRWHMATEQEVQDIIQPKSRDIVVQQPLQPKQQQQKLPRPKKDLPQDEFSGIVDSYLKKNSLVIREKISQRKNREVILEATITSSIGGIEMLVIAKNKAKITDSDLSLAFQKGQSRKLPIIFLISGELTKKAEQYREKHLKGYVLVRKL